MIKIRSRQFTLSAKYPMRLTFSAMPALMLLLLVSCKKETDPNAGGRPEFAYNVKAATFLDMINNVRKSGCKCGNKNMPPVAALQWSDLLAKAAFDHSEDMSRRKYFEHKSPDGTTVSDRFRTVGYRYSWAGENIARGQTTEQEVFNSWINSERHCRNIMNGEFKETGLGRSENYWTQTLGASQ